MFAPFARLSKEARELYLRRSGYALCVILSALIVVLVGGDTTAPIRHALGLDPYVKKRTPSDSVFGDCSKPENRSNPHCQVQRRTYIERNWNELKHRESGKTTQFSLW